MRGVRRRSVWAAAWALGALGLAGCVTPTDHAPKAPPGLESAELYQGPGGGGGGASPPASVVLPAPRATPPRSAPMAVIPQVTQARPAPAGELKPDPVLISDAGIRDLRVSASRGQAGGVVVLWPRVVPSSQTEAARPVAAAIQQQLRQLTTHAAPGKPLDVRPEPERVCPRAGCAGASVGAMLAISPGGACAVVGWVAGPGPGTMRLFPWVGEVTLKQEVIDFREPPESFVVIEDYASCESVAAKLAQGNPAMEAALR